ncbi:MAG: hypothetical protein A2806_00315 [Candidatus Terrybacteria bacterium RIFCSPHIGHO2_01_FULL_48_17]|uniref:Histidine-specific methyltransferase SAM-dependent domain-containing protein n=1 Tax=Candidatus Terrybacteria bacterium RIFCSPHIGHO2_01_FULL_48_17 TaxID=1802362 RepID=A0A1G2PLE9_9BACT|nr:MAG: hypothetical protein A2806_00315 [Candidatus Terrybacteria bacterium RIFCSPHIGHO2_01_FULL_48_17]OHA53658.1 MAG: hypothetical protein A3A30_00635 [Candidatus Terrybacteria bacterium RIFCSPLOWO2_01_FULL_48_14]
MFFSGSPSAKSQLISEILSDLAFLRQKESSSDILYAVDENIRFFEAAQNIPKYLWWLITRAPRINGDRLLELADFPFPRWDRELQERLIEIERKDFPGLIRPLRKKIVQYIKEHAPSFIFDLGGGGMEVERQVMETLILQKYTAPLIFVNIEKSEAALNVSRDNLKTLSNFTDFLVVEHLDFQHLRQLKENMRKNFLVIFAHNDIFSLSKYFSNKSIDLLFHSKFRHHLRGSEKLQLDKIIGEIAQTVFEYDDVKSPFLFLPPSIAAWKHPVLLNGAIFSRLRDPKKSELKKNRAIEFFSVGSYLRTIV